MKKILFTLICMSLILQPTFADLEGTTQEDIMLTSLEDSVTITSDVQEEKIEFYRDGKVPTLYPTLEALLKNEKNVTTITDGCNNGFVMGTGAALTMMYCEEVYGKDGSEKWQRTDTKVSIYGDNVSYFNQKLFQKLDANEKLKTQIQSKFASVSEKKLTKANEKISQMIEIIKLSRISRKMQESKITQLYFIKISLEDALRR